MSGSWLVKRKPLSNECGEKLAILREGRAVSFEDVIAGWQDNSDCRTTFLEALSQARFAGFFWEMPPIARGHTDTGYECVLIESRALRDFLPDREAFAEKFEQTADPIAIFPNLGGDALLVAPQPVGEVTAYAHLAEFVRHGPDAQRHEFLQALGRAAERLLESRSGRIWISTSGLGIAWLHARLDSRPKYYQHRPYREC